eukprot:s2152_g12.t1
MGCGSSRGTLAQRLESLDGEAAKSLVAKEVQKGLEAQLHAATLGRFNDNGWTVSWSGSAHWGSGARGSGRQCPRRQCPRLALHAVRRSVAGRCSPAVPTAIWSWQAEGPILAEAVLRRVKAKALEALLVAGAKITPEVHLALLTRLNGSHGDDPRSVVKVFLDHGLDVNLVDSSEHGGGRTLLMAAICSGDVQLVEETGPGTQCNRAAPLVAAAQAHEEEVDILLQRGAAVTTKNEDGHSAVMSARLASLAPNLRLSNAGGLAPLVFLGTPWDWEQLQNAVYHRYFTDQSAIPTAVTQFFPWVSSLGVLQGLLGAALLDSYHLNHMAGDGACDSEKTDDDVLYHDLPR